MSLVIPPLSRVSGALRALKRYGARRAPFPRLQMAGKRQYRTGGLGPVGSPLGVVAYWEPDRSEQRTPSRVKISRLPVRGGGLLVFTLTEKKEKISPICPPCPDSSKALARA